MKYTVFTKTKKMKTGLSKKIILGALVLSTTFTYAQKKNTTNAAMSYNEAQKAAFTWWKTFVKSAELKRHLLGGKLRGKYRP